MPVYIHKSLPQRIYSKVELNRDVQESECPMLFPDPFRIINACSRKPANENADSLRLSKGKKRTKFGQR